MGRNIRLIRLIAVIGLFGAGMVGCSRKPAAPAAPVSDIVVVTGQAPIEGGGPAASPAAIPAAKFSGLAGMEFTGEGSAALPASATSQGQRLALARAESRRAALRKIAEQAAQTKSDKGPTLGQLMTLENGWAARLQGLIEARASVEFAEQGDRIAARATLPGAAVAEGMGFGAAEADAAQLAEQDAARRTDAQARAIKAARGRLYDELLQAKLGNGTLRSAAEADPELATRIQSLAESAEPTAIVFTPDGLCKATLQFDRARAAALLSRGTKPNAPAPSAK